MLHHLMRPDYSSVDDLIPTVPLNMLAIGDLTRWRHLCSALPEFVHLSMVTLGELDAQTFADLNPDIIYSPLVAPDFDAINVADQLNALKYHGQYRALVDHVPNPAAICAEIRSHAPAIDFELVFLPPIAND